MSRVLPILFNTDMVRAILDGRKTVTRRVLKHPFEVHPNGFITKPKGNERLCPYEPPYQPGNILYVREAWGTYNRNWWEADYFLYRADYPDGATTYMFNDEKACDLPRWRPSIHMPKEAARIWLKVTDVRAERLQEIMNDPPGPDTQIVREGCKYGCDFIATWESTIKKTEKGVYGWDANPWVWVIEFERCEYLK